MKLQESVVAITGGARGLGKSIALDLAKKGSKIALIDLDETTLNDAQAELEALGATVGSFKCNVADEEDVEQTFSRIRQELGSVDAVINNAGILRDALLVKAKEGKISRKMSLSEWQAVINVNLTGVFLCGREAASQMIEANKGGCIINISSIAKAGNVGQSNYSAAKAGVAAMTVTWAKELARYNIRSMAIAPGFIETEMTASMPQEALDKSAKMIPLQRIGQPNHISQTVCFILENDYLSGRVIEVDGGLRL